ncbi:MAG: protoporphyrinogen oxidase, partial [Candidatus Obscuribacterales bacterium]|nr:protoporphyrinogen oxidase [Candidatus Obscuribacterales bacterium]
MPDLSKKRIVIIGGGIAGLAACNRILELVSQSGLEPEIVLLEARDRLGGVIKTRHVEGCLLETGPDAFITQKPWAVELCKRLDIVDQLVNTNPDRRLTMIVKDGRLHGVPDGFMMLAPTRIWPFLRSPVFSIKGKLRMALEYFLPAGKEKVDETLAQFVSRRLGQEALDRIAQPMVGGIYASDPCRLSLKATMPRFLQMEQEHGGVLKALLNMPASND